MRREEWSRKSGGDSTAGIDELTVMGRTEEFSTVRISMVATIAKSWPATASAVFRNGVVFRSATKNLAQQSGVMEVNERLLVAAGERSHIGVSPPIIGQR